MVNCAFRIENPIWKILWSRPGLSTLGWIAAEAVANSALAIALIWLARKSQTENFNIADGAILIVALISLRYICQGASNISASRWHCMSTFRFVDLVSHRVSFRTDIYRSDEVRGRHTADVVSPGLDIVSGVGFYVERVLRTSAGALTISVSVGAMLGSALVIAAGISLATSFWFAQRMNTVLSSKSERFENERTFFSRLILQIWENVVIGNPHCAAAWTRRMKRRQFSYLARLMRATLLQTTVQIGLFFLVISPLVAGILIDFRSFGQSKAQQVALLAAIPFLLTLIGYLCELSSIFAARGSLAGQLIVLARMCTVPDTVNLLNRVDFSKLQFSRNDQSRVVSSMEEALDQLPICGRITVSGANGSGKTSLLLLFKQHFGDSAFYWSAGSRVLPVSSRTGSTGQQALHTILDAEVRGYRVLLLDEWNANLDPAAEAVAAACLERLVLQGTLIVDVVHHQMRAPIQSFVTSKDYVIQ